MTLYHVRYRYYSKEESRFREPETVVLVNIHPLEWASTPPDVFRKHFWTEILDWREVHDPEGHILAAIEEGAVLSVDYGGADREKDTRGGHEDHPDPPRDPRAGEAPSEGG